MSDDGAAARQREASRQQALLGLLWRQPPQGEGAAWWRDPPARVEQGLSIYRANGRALARRALAAAFPTVEGLIGGEAFAGLSHAFWQRQPPSCGDIARHGAGLPAFIAADAQLADEPYLADSARLDWAIHVAETAADGSGAAPGLQRLAEGDPDALWLQLRPGLALLRSPWPVAAIWRAQRSQAAADFDIARDALAQRRGDDVLVWRDGWRAAVSTLEAPAARFTAAVLDGQPLAQALREAGDAFDFERWLLQALRERWLAGVSDVAVPGTAAAAVTTAPRSADA
jgi:hypothetical protein